MLPPSLTTTNLVKEDRRRRREEWSGSGWANDVALEGVEPSLALSSEVHSVGHRESDARDHTVSAEVEKVDVEQVDAAGDVTEPAVDVACGMTEVNEKGTCFHCGHDSDCLCTCKRCDGPHPNCPLCKSCNRVGAKEGKVDEEGICQWCGHDPRCTCACMQLRSPRIHCIACSVKTSKDEWK